MDLGLAGRVYVVTGASRGLGLATAEKLVADGARVVLCSRDPERVGSAAWRLGADVAVGVAADLGREPTATTLVGTARERFGRLDGAVISVGGPPTGPVGSVTDEQWRQSFDTVFLGSLRLARAVLEVGRDTDPVAVTFVLSTSVKTPLAAFGISNGLRPGLAMAAKSLADEYGPTGARVNALLPGRTDTDRVREVDAAGGDPEATRQRYAELIPLGRYGRPEEFGTVAAFVTSPAASYLTGTTITVDGGLTRTL